MSCLLPVRGGSNVVIYVGSGGAGGKGKNGLNNDGASGEPGRSSVILNAGRMPRAAQGHPGGGGDASGLSKSGNASSRGKGGSAADSKCPDGSDIKITPGEAGDPGAAGSTGSPGAGGIFGAPGMYADTCPKAGVGGHGGGGAGADSNGSGGQAASGNGKPGRDGCVVLTY
jgi:hypothetical protein